MKQFSSCKVGSRKSPDKYLNTQKKNKNWRNNKFRLIIIISQKMRHAYNPERQFTVYNNHLPVLRVTIHLQSVGPFS